MQQTIEQLQYLRLNGLLEAWQQQQAQPTYQDLSFDERLALLVESEYLRRQNQRMHRRLKQARLFTNAALDDVDFQVKRGLNKAHFLQWTQGQWLSKHLNLMLIGPTGVGKTFLSCVLAEHLCKQGMTVRYFKTADLICQLKMAKVDGSFPKFRKQLAAFNLIVLDEWLRDPLSDHDAREILDFLDERYRRASCLFATQLPIKQWHQKIEEPTLADAILDRIVHDSVRVMLKGESMRKLTSSMINEKQEDSPAEKTT
ncbi:Insertion sequence IS5376 putative ATP-binding protein [Acaryochloris thomasi RCC1774]|uniref:Insertion sequence IS5376 putative ATP-binding protein n=1 Tax=Acaryochloris thomasi RCC1774 TaxID=1764569 RepID=A0A2W1JEY4_9CYAN|nr:IS21-like element helper ATPase IstB [Acaryochloris thomasi]PZD70295.1 Insertion sequence IS5376 putative ATP-binding protein [Acaryochloris thomasi RCC1774]